MKKPALILALLTIVSFCSSAYSVVILENKNITLEGAKIEILHNFETNKGTIIGRHASCASCPPVVLNYEGQLSFSINGIDKAYSPNSPKLGEGDLSYNPEDMVLDHVNLYQ